MNLHLVISLMPAASEAALERASLASRSFLAKNYLSDEEGETCKGFADEMSAIE
jgi:hypothetical protein